MKEFDYFDFEEVKDGKWSKIRVEGRKYEIAYYLKSGATKPGEVEIVRNYTNAIQTVGGIVLGEKRGVAHMKLLKDGNETWIKVFAGGAGAVYQLTIIEKKQWLSKWLLMQKHWNPKLKRNGEQYLSNI